MNRDSDTRRDRNDVDVDVMYASTYAIDEKLLAVFLRLHTSACDRAAAVALLKELLQLVAGRGGGGDGGGVKEDKVNLAIEDLVPEGKKNKPFWARGLDVLGYSLNADSPRRSRMVRLQLNAEETKRLLDFQATFLCVLFGRKEGKTWGPWTVTTSKHVNETWLMVVRNKGDRVSQPSALI